MSLLTDDEIQKATGASDVYWANSKLFIIGIARAIESALIAKLAAGVSVEPVATVQTRRMQPLGDACGVEAHLHHYQHPGALLYTATAIAAARVQENARIVELCKKRWKGGYPQEVIDDLVIAIRALLGKEAQS